MTMTTITHTPDEARESPSERAIVARINRRLRPGGMLLRRTRGWRARLDLGDYYVHDFMRNLALDTHVDPEDYLRDLAGE